MKALLIITSIVMFCPVVHSATLYVPDDYITIQAAIDAAGGGDTILWNNEAPFGPEIWIGNTSLPSTLTIGFSNVEGGQVRVYVDPGCTLNWGPGMIDMDPVFVDPASDDFHISWSSPCRNGGHNSGVPVTEDFEGDPRIHEGAADMGADEFHLHLYHVGDVAPGNRIDVKVVGPPWTAPVILGLGSGIEDPPRSSIYGDFWLKLPLLDSRPMAPVGASGLSIRRFTVPAEWIPGQRYPLQALVGINLSNLMVLSAE